MKVPEFTPGPLNDVKDLRIAIEELTKILNELIRRWNSLQPPEG